MIYAACCCKIYMVKKKLIGSFSIGYALPSFKSLIDFHNFLLGKAGHKHLVS